MEKRAKQIKSVAREALKGNWLVAIVAYVLTSIVKSLADTLLVNTVDWNIGISYAIDWSNPMEIPSAIMEYINNFWTYIPDEEKASFTLVLILTCAAVGIIASLVKGIAHVGYNKFNIDLVDRGQSKVTTVFSGWKNLLKVAGLYLFMGFFTFLWSLLFFIPGIIASYRYAMAPYIMAENPEIGIREAMNKSKEMMKGNKWRFFCLQFSFIGWYILATILCYGIGFLWLYPYVFASYAAFYNEVSGKGNALGDN